jgi:hypothetical protein
MAALMDTLALLIWSFFCGLLGYQHGVRRAYLGVISEIDKIENVKRRVRETRTGDVTL